MAEIVIVGAGPAGISAAATLAAAGHRPIVLDEGARPGGQVWRQPGPGLDLDMGRMLGSEAAKYRRIHATFEAIRGGIDYRPGTLVWAVSEGRLFTVSEGRTGELAYAALILATGATDRVMPIPGWTLPGVFTLGGAQVLLKEHGCLIGRDVVLAGSSPLLYLAARQYLAVGGRIRAILDTTPLAAKLGAAPGSARESFDTLKRGLGYMAEVRRQGVRIVQGVRDLAITGRERVEAISFRRGSRKPETIACDGVALGFGLKPETQLAELAGARFAFDATFSQWLPVIDEDGGAGARLHLAGDGATIGGADAAEASGELVALALLADRGERVDTARRHHLRSEVARWRRFQSAMAKAFAWPVAAVGAMGDDVMVCRCEGVTAGMLRASLGAAYGADEMNRLKALTRAGMGRCQGRMCGPAVAAITAAARGVTLAEAGRLRVQAPVKPLVMAAAPGETAP